MISCSIGNRPTFSNIAMNRDHSAVWLLRVLAGDASKHLSPSSHQLMQEWVRVGLRGRPLEAEGKDPQSDCNSPRPIETLKSAEMFWLGYAVLKGKRMVKKLLVNLHVYSMCDSHGVFKHVSLLGVNHWKPVKHLWNTTFFGLKSTSAFCSEDIFPSSRQSKKIRGHHVSELLKLYFARHVECECVQAGDHTGATGGLGELCEYEIHQGGWSFWW